MKDIPGYEGKYAATRCGKIYSHKRKKFLKTRNNPKGYHEVNLSPGHMKILHRLIAKTYLSKYSEKLQVNHKDCNRTNNNVSNLEMVTNRQNMDHALKFHKRYFTKSMIKQVIRLRIKGLFFSTIAEIVGKSRPGCCLVYKRYLKGKYESKKRG